MRTLRWHSVRPAGCNMQLNCQSSEVSQKGFEPQTPPLPDRKSSLRCDCRLFKQHTAFVYLLILKELVIDKCCTHFMERRLDLKIKWQKTNQPPTRSRNMYPSRSQPTCWYWTQDPVQFCPLGSLAQLRAHVKSILQASNLREKGCNVNHQNKTKNC